MKIKESVWVPKNERPESEFERHQIQNSPSSNKKSFLSKKAQYTLQKTKAERRKEYYSSILLQ